MKITRREFNGRAIRTSGAGLLALAVPGSMPAQDVGEVAFQPFAAEVTRLLAALEMLGEGLPASEAASVRTALAGRDERVAVNKIVELLDRHVLMQITVNPENRISVGRGDAEAKLIEGGWRSFLLKVKNESGTTAALKIKSPQGGPMGRRSSLAITGVHDFTNGAVDTVESRARWLGVATFDQPPMTPTLSGLSLEYRIVQLYSRDRGRREASLEADFGWGEQDLGYRSTLPVLFECLPCRELTVRVRDEGGVAATASLLITDGLGRVYPAQTKRELPDLAFEPQIYRADGETLRLPDGVYTIECGRGPEYVRQRKKVVVDGASKPIEVSLERWFSPSKFGYYSGDTHIHAAGCSHYESPSEGVVPEVMVRQVEGEALDVGSVLNWGPGFEYQKQFFKGHVEAIGATTHQHHAARHDVGSGGGGPIVRYDIEVSGFPSSHCGHLVLLRLKEQRFPGATTIDQWPSWNIPIERWAKEQGALVGYAHSAHGLVVDSTALPNFLMPPFNSMGANEYIVDVTHEGVIDFISGCDLWPFAELNIWYHTLNCGFRTAFVGETDFPCITDECVGGGRSYVHVQPPPTGDDGYSRWLERLMEGDAYFGDGRAHILQFAVEQEGRTGRELLLPASGRVRVQAQVCARLSPEQSGKTRAVQHASPYDKPYWHLERARIGETRKVPVEVIVNGLPAGRREIEADGALHQVDFEVEITRSSWVALRILPSVHTNAMFVLVGGAPVRSSRTSAEWCRKAVDVCWEQKRTRIRSAELPAAEAAYDHARRSYDRIVGESYRD